MSGDHLSEVHQQGSSGAATHSVASASTSTYTASAARKKRRRDENEDLNNQRLEVFNQHTTWSAFEDSCTRTKWQQPSELIEMRGYINNTVAKHWYADGTKPAQEEAYKFRRHQALNPLARRGVAAIFGLSSIKPSPVAAPSTMPSSLTATSSSSTSASPVSTPSFPDNPSNTSSMFSLESFPMDSGTSSKSYGSKVAMQERLKSLCTPAKDISQARSLKDIYPGHTFKLSSGEEVHILEYLKKHPMETWKPYTHTPAMNRLEDDIRRTVEIRKKIMEYLKQHEKTRAETSRKWKRNDSVTALETSKAEAEDRAAKLEKELAIATEQLRKLEAEREAMIHDVQLKMVRAAASNHPYRIPGGAATNAASLYSPQSPDLHSSELDPSEQILSFTTTIDQSPFQLGTEELTPHMPTPDMFTGFYA